MNIVALLLAAGLVMHLRKIELSSGLLLVVVAIALHLRERTEGFATINNADIARWNDAATAAAGATGGVDGISEANGIMTIAKPVIFANGAAVSGRFNFFAAGKTDDGTDPYHLEKIESSGDNNELRLTLNDNAEEKFTIFSDSCASPGGCAGPGTELFKFDGAGNFTINNAPQ